MTYEWLAILILAVSWAMLYVAYVRLLDFAYRMRDQLNDEHAKINSSFESIARDFGVMHDAMKRADERIKELGAILRMQVEWVEGVNKNNDLAAAFREGTISSVALISKQMTSQCERIGKLEARNADIDKHNRGIRV